MGQEFRGKGIHVALSPAVNLARVPAGGRNWEGPGADPFLAGEFAFESVTGLQSAGVQGDIFSERSCPPQQNCHSNGKTFHQ